MSVCNTEMFGNRVGRVRSDGCRLIRCHPPLAVPAFSAPEDAPTDGPAGVENSKLPASARRAFDAALLLREVHPGDRDRLGCRIRHRRLPFWSADSFIGPALGAALASVPGRIAPWIDAATAHPTRPSSQ